MKCREYQWCWPWYQFQELYSTPKHPLESKKRGEEWRNRWLRQFWDCWVSPQPRSTWNQGHTYIIIGSNNITVIIANNEFNLSETVKHTRIRLLRSRSLSKSRTRFRSLIQSIRRHAAPTNSSICSYEVSSVLNPLKASLLRNSITIANQGFGDEGDTLACLCCSILSFPLLPSFFCQDSLQLCVSITAVL